jgi:hypothetical protein
MDWEDQILGDEHIRRSRSTPSCDNINARVNRIVFSQESATRRERREQPIHILSIKLLIPLAQTAAINASSLATKDQQHELQVVVGTLLHYARTVDPSMLTAVHKFGFVEAKPTIHDKKKVERPAVSFHRSERRHTLLRI